MNNLENTENTNALNSILGRFMPNSGGGINWGFALIGGLILVGLVIWFIRSSSQETNQANAAMYGATALNNGQQNIYATTVGEAEKTRAQMGAYQQSQETRAYNTLFQENQTLKLEMYMDAKLAHAGFGHGGFPQPHIGYPHMGQPCPPPFTQTNYYGKPCGDDGKKAS